MVDTPVVVNYSLHVITLFTTPVFDTWMAKLSDLRARQRIVLRLRSLELGNFGDCRSVGVGVSELRVDYEPGYQVYFCRRGREVVILLCGGEKSGQRRDVEGGPEAGSGLEGETG